MGGPLEICSYQMFMHQFAKFGKKPPKKLNRGPPYLEKLRKFFLSKLMPIHY